MRLLHTMLRVTDLQKSISFYTEILQMKLLRRKDFPDGKFTLAFLGYGPEHETTALELTHNWETSSYEMGNAYGHIAIEVEDVYDACEKIKAQGGQIVREPGPMLHGSTILAFARDPDGYMIELLGS
ncbi:lactoylglutathione lyase [Amphritea japonica]|uniref:lactoylglutathione lyase n=1 Tax=Amphritea japonica ATCC BAA-1530 TaxID=1278309 RepID=A0A7R6PN96_9GAMM|nr:lactoylglutathione lyase [Amphritea japonica]BBB27425.1 lactoylglutathione lyase [Amphritea japonica ATCC BAA-1530]